MKILVISLSNLGDALLTYPALHALWQSYPDGEFHFLVSPRTRELFEGDPRVNQIWIWEKKASILKQILLLARFSQIGFDLVVDFRNSLIPFFIPGAKRAPLLRRPPSNGVHRAQAHLDLVTALGIPPSSGRMSLPFGPKEEAQIQVWLEAGRRPVVMVPGARSHLKRWGAEKFAEVADRLIERDQAQILLVGEEQERPIAEEVKRRMRHSATDLVGRTSIRELAALLTRVSLLVTNDSACLHAAEVMEVPVVALFGPTDEKKYGPRNPRSVVIRRQLVCAPCERALCPYDHECMKWVTGDEVYAAAAKVLQDSAHPELVEG